MVPYVKGVHGHLAYEGHVIEQEQTNFKMLSYNQDKNPEE